MSPYSIAPSARQFRFGSRAVLPLLFLAILQPLGGAASCDPIPCTSTHPDYNPLTGLCTQPSDEVVFGPPAPGTGNLPTEPDTPTPDPADDVDPDDVDLAIYGLNGRWTDTGRSICITHTGSGVTATYIDTYICDHADGTGQTSTSTKDFDAQLTGDMLEGDIVVCRFGHDDGSNGTTETSFSATISPDGKTIEGTWFNSETLEDIPITITRDTVGNCGI